MSDNDHNGSGCPLPSDTVGCRLQRLGRAQYLMLAAGLDRIGLHAGQEHALSALFEFGPQTQAGLAARVGVDTSTICRTLQRLERAGYVVRTPGEADRRTTVVTATEAAQALRDGLAGIYDRTEERLTAALTDAERTELRRLLQKMIDSLTE
jgi:MarR family transcriptional regulator, organic hydroperoxide resistance regulator